ncbi:MAG: hypothetical protein QXL57_09100 [Candidatus Bathyarchaeia archaeon]
MGRRKADGRHLWFSIRLSEAEYEDMQRILAIAERYSQNKQAGFRLMIHELADRLYVDLGGNLRLKPSKADLLNIQVEAKRRQEEEEWRKQEQLFWRAVRNSRLKA